MNVTNFVLTQLQKRSLHTEDLEQVLGEGKSERLAKTLKTLERQGKIRREGENVWVLR